MKVCLGGTFDILHAGHEALLRRAFALGDEEVVIGITSDRMARRTRKRVNPLAVRRRNLRALLRRRRWRHARLSVLDEVAGPAAFKEDLDAIVVSAERVEAAHAINRERRRRGRKAMDVVVVPMVLAEDSLPIASRRIRAGDIDRKGRRRRPLLVLVGTTNRVKLEASRRAFASVFSGVRVEGVAVAPEVSAQPYEGETIAGAVARARGAMKATGTADYGVGIEAGLFWSEAARDYLDVQYCAIVDRRGVVTVGHGPGFRYPPAVIEAVKGRRTVGDAMEAVTGVRGIGRTQGAIGWLS
ncbi:MAG: inosine/xanthosine triphosphatase, partial [Candidatus Thermoplasmatota archaeon]